MTFVACSRSQQATERDGCSSLHRAVMFSPVSEMKTVAHLNVPLDIMFPTASVLLGLGMLLKSNAI